MKNWKIILILLTSSLFLTACVGAPNEQTNSGGQTQTNKDPNKKVKIGFAMDTVKEERWQRDRAAFEAHCKELNVDCIITVADNNAEKQSNDVENLLTQGIDALVIAPHDAKQAGQSARRSGNFLRPSDKFRQNRPLYFTPSSRHRQKNRRIRALKSSQRQLRNGLRRGNRQQCKNYAERTNGGFTAGNRPRRYKNCC